MNKIRSTYDLATAPLRARLDELCALESQGELSIDLQLERAELMQKWIDEGQKLYTAFCEWSEKECGYQPVRAEDVQKVLGGKG